MPRTHKQASISAATSGNNTLVAAGAVTAQFQSGAGGAARTGVMSLITGVPLVVPYSPNGHFDTADAALLNLSLGGAVQVSGHLTYVEVTP